MDAADPMAQGSMAPFWMGGRRALAVDAAGNAVIVNDGARYPWDTAATGSSADKYGVLLRTIPAAQ
jgi:hypothetical protein